MLFNSIDFAIFLPLVFCLYWLLQKRELNLQNLLIVVASYVFYGWWDYRFLALIVVSTLVDFYVALVMGKTTRKRKRKILLGLSLAVNLGMLGFFKYYNFFIDSWVEAWQLFGVTMEVSSLRIILPVGISFYTFQTLSYTIDVYRKQIQPTRNLIEFAAFVAFFPQLVAGPIERAKSLLPQFSKPRVFHSEFAMSGFYLIIWGLFKKMVIADNCAFFVNQIFDGSAGATSMELFLGAVLFGFQIYGDFSGYSDIAIGVARLFGFSLMVNFSFPYFSRNIAEFWRRWHISLSTWFRDYLYIPLGGSRGTRWEQIRNVSIVFLVSGFWHGANWTFIIWGAIHAALFLPLMLRNTNRTYLATSKIVWSQLPRILMTFAMVTLAWVFFRADTVTMAFDYIINMFSGKGLSLGVFVKSSKTLLFSAIIITSILVMLGFEWRALRTGKKEVVLTRYRAVVVALMICFMGVFKNPSDFIYFQF